MSSYYKQELDRILPKDMQDLSIDHLYSIRVIDNKGNIGSTKWLGVNSDSINDILDFFNAIKASYDKVKS